VLAGLLGRGDVVADRNTILRVRGLKKHFPIRKGIFKKVVGLIRAVDGVDFYLDEGESLGLVGESGCGKTTTARCVARLIQPTEGSIEFAMGNTVVDLASLSRKELKPFRREIQTVFQDPYSSLDPRMTIGDIMMEPLNIQGMGTKKEREDIAGELLTKVGLGPSYMTRYPHELSGGQRQRIGIARALTLRPRILICDEPVSALDVSVQAQVLNLLSDLQEEYNLTYLFIAHDLSVIEHVSDRVAVMYLGKIVEVARKERIFQNPKHPYTAALLAAIPVGDPLLRRRRQSLEGSVPNPASPPPGCHFHTRCAYAQDICSKERPELREIDDESTHYVACHFAEELSLPGLKPRETRELGGNNLQAYSS
jgi:peptide/nickel transport system ATP-binding protein